jgi:hypothetical protein
MTRITSVIHVFSFENPRHGSQVLGRLFTRNDFLYLLLQLVSQDSVRELFQLIRDLSYPGVSRTEFQFCCLRIRFVSPGVVCFRSVDLGISWTFLVI